LELNSFQKALKTLELPPFVTKDEIKIKYKELAKKYHPDKIKDNKKMQEINSAYKLLMDYIENFRYSFDENEISKQIPEYKHNKKFKI